MPDCAPEKVWLITGSTGIAAATIKLAARQGIAVFFVSHDAESCAALQHEIGPDGSAFYVADLTKADEASAAVGQCVSRFQRIDALFNVVGISGRRFGDGPLHECTDEGWDVTMRVNLNSMFLMCRAVLRQMLNQPIGENGLRGAILNMSSVLAVAPEAQHFATHAYAASKGAILSLTQAMAAYYAPHKIRVNALAPGLVRTPMSRRAQQNQTILELMKTKQPLCEDLLDADEVAQAALFLLGDESRQITGTMLKVDAGWSVS